MSVEKPNGTTGSTSYPMKITIEFTLPENDQEYDDFKNGPYYRAILTDFKNHIRSVNKYGTDKGSAPQEVDDLYRHLCECIAAYNLEL